MMSLRLSMLAMAALVVLGGCAHHPLDCALGFMNHDDCLPGTAGYEKSMRALYADDAQCSVYGVDDPAYSACRENLAQGRVERSQAALGAFVGAMAAVANHGAPTVVPTPFPIPLPVSIGCETGHWVGSVTSDGGVVILEDQSVWVVAPLDRITTMLWLPTTNVVACPDKLINPSARETAEARRVS